MKKEGQIGGASVAFWRLTPHLSHQRVLGLLTMEMIFVTQPIGTQT